MSAIGQLVWSEGNSTGDPSFASVVQLAHFDGTNGSTTFTNSCARGNALGVISGTPTIATAQSVFGGASANIPAASLLATVGHADYNFGTADFTVELRARFNSLVTKNFYDMRNGSVDGPTLYITSAGSIRMFASSADRITSSNGVISATTWYAVALSRVSGVSRLFVDGTQVGSNFTDGFNYGNLGSCKLTVGSGDGGLAGPNPGYYDELRVTKGVGRYAANYTPAVAAFPDY